MEQIILIRKKNTRRQLFLKTLWQTPDFYFQKYFFWNFKIRRILDTFIPEKLGFNDKFKLI